ncbi:MAG: nucleotidyltransferase domain-containing protein [Acidobacteriota bacterium]
MLRERSSGSVKIISIDRDELLARLSSIARRIRVRHPEVREVRLFGSLARGDQTGTSDADLLIVLEPGSEPADPLELTRKYLRYFDLPIGVDLLIVSQEEIIRRRQAGDRFFGRLLNESLLVGPEAKPAADSII